MTALIVSAAIALAAVLTAPVLACVTGRRHPPAPNPSHEAREAALRSAAYRRYQ